MKTERVVCVIDTNIVAAGLITADPDSPTAQILDAMLSGHVLFLMSEELLNEYGSVLRRPKLVRLHQLKDGDIDTLMTDLVANAIWREPHASEQAPDTGDNHLWALLACHAGSMLITGDQLLIDKPPPEHSVMSARSFLDLHHLPATR